jgi:hypothetical protein
MISQIGPEKCHCQGEQGDRRSGEVEADPCHKLRVL